MEREPQTLADMQAVLDLMEILGCTTAYEVSILFDWTLIRAQRITTKMKADGLIYAERQLWDHRNRAGRSVDILFPTDP